MKNNYLLLFSVPLQHKYNIRKYISLKCFLGLFTLSIPTYNLLFQMTIISCLTLYKNFLHIRLSPGFLSILFHTEGLIFHILALHGHIQVIVYETLTWIISPVMKYILFDLFIKLYLLFLEYKLCEDQSNFFFVYGFLQLFIHVVDIMWITNIRF